jgi:protein gp37
VRWISAEPLLGPIDLTRMGPRKFASALDPSTDQDTNAIRHGLDWVVVGGESGPGARPMDLAWATSLRDQCARAGIPFHFKQGGSVLGRAWGGHSKGGDPANWPESFPREYPAVAS